jgi:hypothetical protein
MWQFLSQLVALTQLSQFLSAPQAQIAPSAPNLLYYLQVNRKKHCRKLMQPRQARKKQPHLQSPKPRRLWRKREQHSHLKIRQWLSSCGRWKGLHSKMQK